MTTNNQLEPRAQILKQRSDYLSTNPRIFAGNTRFRRDYLNQLIRIKPHFTQFQREYMVGLLLGDASAQKDDDTGTARVQIQQACNREDWLNFVRQVFLEYTANDLPLSAPSTRRPNMRSLNTLKCTSIYTEIVPLLYDNGAPRKRINDLIRNYITPVSVAAWFCGDGCTTEPKGKNITLASQGFTEDENKILADALNNQLGLNAKVKQDSPDINAPNQRLFHIEISGRSFETFVIDVGPYIHSAFFYRVPSGRVENSQHGFMDEALRDKYLGSRLQNLDNLIINY